MVNNAIVAGRHSKGLLETEPEDWDAIMDVGLRGVFLCCKRAVQQMLGQQPVAEARGRIINISSQHGMIGAPGHVAYCTAKGGVINLTHQLAVDFGPQGVIVNGLAPGKIRIRQDSERGAGLLARAHAILAIGTARRRRRRRAVPGLRRVHVRERHQPAGRRRVDGVLAQSTSVHQEVKPS